MSSDTIFALSSGRPPAAISVIRVSGAAAHAAGSALCGDLPEARKAAVRDLRHPSSGELLDRALVLRFDGPASSTGEDGLELHCHGGRAVVDAVLKALADVPGLRVARPGEFTRRAFENGRIDLTEAEGLADLIEAETESQRRAALLLAEGGLRQQIDRWQEQALLLSARAEQAIDYVGDDDEGNDGELGKACTRLADELAVWLARPRVEPLKDGIRVVVAGPPNAGKSSLINAIVGQDRVIVSDIAGTTRDYVEIPLAIGGMPFLLTDTAGLRETADEVEAIGIARAAARIGAADILLWLGDPRDAPEHPRQLHLHAKCDLSECGRPPEGSLPVSAKTGEGLPALLSALADLAAGLLPADDAVALNNRQARHIGNAKAALRRAGESSDIVIQAEELRAARTAFDQLTGRAGFEDVLDALFGRFCLGK